MSDSFHARLTAALNYDAETGIFTWSSTMTGNAKKGSVAGNILNNGYIRISVFGKRYLAHHLAWAYCYGKLPTENMDHINGNKGDNRICNLRLASQSQNMMNQGLRSDNTSGYKGVYYRHRLKKWQAMISVNGKRKTLGHYSTPELAYEAYKKEAVLNYGDYARV